MKTPCPSNVSESSKPESPEAAFSLLESIVSLLIVSVAAVAIAGNFADHLKANTSSERRTDAIQAAQYVLDELRIKDPATMPMSGSTVEVVTIDLKQFQVAVTYCRKSQYCAVNSSRHIAVEAKLKGKSIYAVETVFSQLK